MTTSLRIHEIAEGGARILNPVSLDQLLTIGESVGVNTTTKVLDLCCGKGEMLTQWASRFGCTGHGVDASAVFLRTAIDRADELGVADRVTFSEGDADDFETRERFDVVCCIGASWFAGDLARSMARMQSWAAPGATLLLGEPFWVTEPAAGAKAGFGQEFHSLPGLFDWLESVGLEVVEMVLADGNAWDRYCAPQWKNLYDWLLANPHDPDAPAVRERLVSHRKRYVTDQRDHLGWGIFALRPVLT
ncbi:MAG: SAM-dependent methyltransferase [Mycobacteriaceae bacterium]